MKWSALMLTGSLAASFGCGSDEAAPGTPAQQPEASQPASEQQPAPVQPTQPAPQATAPRPVSRAGSQDEPWTPTHTGTVSPGMTRDDVIAVWGEPIVERQAGNASFMYFRNGCEVSCGTFDVVFLDGGQVVDAIVRGQGHTYTGQSSSPPDRVAAPTLPDVPSQGSAGVPE